MSESTLAALIVVAAWWSSTALVLRLVWLPRTTHGASVAVSSVLASAALYGVWWSSRIESVGAAYLAFAFALVVWAWHELTFLLGLVTGPRRLACPADARGWRRFWLATATVIHHELALAATMLALVALTWGGGNQVATWTYGVLWVMRLSAKLNVFLGVRNVTEEFVPERMRYLISYFRRARMNPLMPLSLGAAALTVIALGASAASAGASPFVATSHALVATILALALLEHLFLALPAPDALLWRWVLRSERARPPAPRLAAASEPDRPAAPPGLPDLATRNLP